MRGGMRRYTPFSAPAPGGKPFLPPPVIFSEFLLILRRKIRAGRRNGTQWIQPDRGSQLIDLVGHRKFPGSSETVARIIHPLRTEPLRSPLLHGDAVFQISSMPGGAFTCSGGGLQQFESVSLKLWFADRMLCDEPGSLRAILARDIFRGPTVLGHQLAKPGRILHVYSLHAWDVRSPKLPRIRQFLAHAPVLLLHGQQFLSESEILHANIMQPDKP